MTSPFNVDATEFFELSKEFARLPDKIKHQVANRALRRIQSKARTQIVRLAAKRIKLPQKIIRGRTSTPYARGLTREVVVKSDWIALGKLGARQTRRGVTVRGRGSYRHAFLATMQSGHHNVFRRAGKARIPIYGLYGPNPANDIRTSPEVYQHLLDDLIISDLAPRMLHELSRALPD